MPKRLSVRYALTAAVLVCFGVVLWGLFEVLTPATELTRFRNSILASVGEPSDFYWTPEHPPDEYKQEALSPPAIFAEQREASSTNNSAVSAMSQLVLHLRSRPKRRGRIQSTTAETYRQIMESGRGYCSDYTQVFNALAHADALPVREWGMSFDRFSGDGHAFSEIYDYDTQQWVFVDPMNGFFVRDSRNARPLSVLQFRDRLNMDGGFQSVDIVPIGDKFLFDSARDAYDYYQTGIDQLYLWFGNNVFSYDRHPVVRFLGSISRPMEQLGAIMAGIHPEIRILPTDTNRLEIASLLRLRYQVVGLAVLAFLLGAAGCVHAAMTLPSLRSSRI